MDSFSRLIASAFLALLLVSPAHAFTEVKESYYDYLVAGVPGSSPSAVCSAAVALHHPTSTPRFPGTFTNTAPSRVYGCERLDADARVWPMGGIYERCPSGFNANTTTARCERTVATCPPPTYPNPQGVCIQPPTCPAAGQPLTTGASVWEVPSLGTSVCHDGCAGSGNAAGAQGGKFYVWGPFTSSGANCTPGSGSSTSAPANPAPDAARPGYCPGTVNGATVQVPCSSSQTKETGSSSSTETSASGVSSGGPSKTTETTTTCANGSCTSQTTTTTTNPDGSKSTTVGTETKPQEKDSFCKQNPALSICKESSISGSCSAVSCSGDAIQCAMAREQARRNCQLIDTPTSLSDIGNAAANGQDPADHPKNHQTSVAINLSSMLDSSPLFGTAGQCPNDVTFTHGEFSFVLPFGSTMCPYLRLLGAAWVAACYLSAAFIVFRRT